MILPLTQTLPLPPVSSLPPLSPCPLQQEEFLIYQDYGKGNEAAQKLLYELEDDENFHAFFLVSLHCLSWVEGV